jgi:DNA-binding NarL/FixJ family response regulator
MKDLTILIIDDHKLVRETWAYVLNEVAAALSISTKNVKVHRYNVLKKLRLKNTGSLIHFMKSNGL